MNARLVVALIGLTLVAGCASNATGSASPPLRGSAPEPSAVASAPSTRTGSLVVVGQIVTMDDPPVAEALLIEDGTVTAVGPRHELLVLAGDQVPVVDIGPNVAYPGFIDAHAHWIGDREYYGIETPAAAMDEALARGWTSISEQWVNAERLDELASLAADDALPLRVDAYLALNYGHDFLGDWYSQEGGARMDEAVIRDRLRDHWQFDGVDYDRSHEIYHDDAVLEFPQSGERFVGKQNFLTWRRRYPAKLDFKIRRMTTTVTCGSQRTSSRTTAHPTCSR